MELLTTEEMYRADAYAIANGVAGPDLMQRAGKAVCDVVTARWKKRDVTVLCGPGNNGGDGFVVARLLADAGWRVRLFLLGDRAALKGDAAHHAALWQGDVLPLDAGALKPDDLVVDALFGAGLARPLEGEALATIRRVRELCLECVAIDVPSGASGDTGEVLGEAAPAVETVTFFRPKPGHYLYPGRRLAGNLTVADIGIPVSGLDEIQPQTVLNGPEHWRGAWPVLGPLSHKYHRGHLLVAGGAQMTGAARLATRAARRTGAGLATILAPSGTEIVYQLDQPGAMVLPFTETETALADDRRNAAIAGPGLGAGEETAELVLAFCQSNKRLVLDADGLSAFAGRPERLFDALPAECILTPHDGEFARLFPGLAGSRLERARAAADLSGAIVVLKGADSVIAAPGGRAAINANAPAWLATGGTGDVLAGIAGGLLARGMPAFEAAAAAVWLHGEAANRYGSGMIAEDLPDQLPGLLGDFETIARRED
jgi:NAD(P)H-hydrate epimerase